MGAVESVPQAWEPDPWWQPSHTQQHNEQDVLLRDRTTGVSVGTSTSDVMLEAEESWLKQIEELDRKVQRLADENMSLVSGKQAAKQTEEEKSEELERLRTQMIQHQQAMERLQEDAVENQKTVKNLQTKLQTSELQRIVADKSTTELNLAIEALQHKHGNSQHENKRLHAQLVIERKEQQQLLIENKRLAALLDSRQSDSAEQQVTTKTEVVAGQTSYEADVETASGSSVEVQERRTLVPSPKATEELERFREEMKTKREARHQALSAISNEMERLKSELNSERAARRKVTEELEEIKAVAEIQDAIHMSTKDSQVEQLKTKLKSEKIEKDKITKELLQFQKQGNEETEEIMKELEIEKERTEYVLNENKHMRAQLEEGDQILQQKLEEYEQLQMQLKLDKEKYQKQVSALKEVVAISKQMLGVRENQVAQLKRSLREIETTVMEKHHGTITEELKAEYQSQMENIKSLKSLYEDRMKVMEVEKEKSIKEREELLQKLESQTKESEERETRIKELELSITERNKTVSDLQDQLSDSLDQSRNLSNELALINNMFTQMLVGTDMDLDKLTRLLQENHDLITEMTIKEDCDETAASLPKLLLDLVTQVNATGDSNGDTNCVSTEATTDGASALNEKTEVSEDDSQEQVVTRGEINKPNEETGCSLDAQEIASKLPKVWKVLLELISHHVVPASSQDNNASEDSKTCCYKSIDTPNGPRLVISVSKTFIRLKDLILEKKSLQKELMHLKQLNGHLECKLTQQERRLSLVSSELRKTWNVVGRMRTQHQQLHTHEKILRYELQQKRKLLNELKQELEYCREKWEEARKKNSQSEVEWRKLRKEFASRKKRPENSLNNSGESGYSDEKGDESGEDDTGQPKSSGLSESNDSSPPRQFEILPVSTNQMQSEIENTEASNSSSQSSSLPDLVSVSTDANLSHYMPTLLLVTESFPEQGPLSCEIAEDGTQRIPEILPPCLHLESTNTIQSKDAVLSSNSSTTEECSTVSLVTLLKQQLACLSQNLEVITPNMDFCKNVKALQSIFSLPPIQIPEHLQQNLMKGSDDTAALHKDLTLSGSTVSTEPINTNDLRESITGATTVVDMNTVAPEVLAAVPLVLESTEVKPHTSTSGECSPKTNRSSEEVLDARAARLQRLEEQCQQLFNKVTKTTHRSTALSNRLEELHEQYGNDNAAANLDTSHTSQIHEEACSSINIPEPPSLPNELPSVRLPTQVQQSIQPTRRQDTRSPEEVLESRAVRLKRLEDQCQQLFNKVTKTSHKSTALSNQLDELHEHYGNRETASNVDFTDDQHEASSSRHIPTPPPLPSKLPSTKLPTQPTRQQDTRSPEEVLESRAVRLKRLEDQCQQLFNKVTKTSHKSTVLSNQLDELHEHYGNRDTASNVHFTDDQHLTSSSNHIPTPPPLPTKLPSMRLPIQIQQSTNANEEHTNGRSLINDSPRESHESMQEESTRQET